MAKVETPKPPNTLDIPAYFPTFPADIRDYHHIGHQCPPVPPPQGPLRYVSCEAELQHLNCLSDSTPASVLPSLVRGPPLLRPRPLLLSSEVTTSGTGWETLDGSTPPLPPSGGRTRPPTPPPLLPPMKRSSSSRDSLRRPMTRPRGGGEPRAGRGGV